MMEKAVHSVDLSAACLSHLAHGPSPCLPLP